MPSLLRKTVLSVLVAAHCLAAISPALAQRENETFGLSPYPEKVDNKGRLNFFIPLERGATFEDAVRVYNRTEGTLNLAIYPADAEVAQDDSVRAVGFRANRPKGVGSWINLAREDVELGPRDEAIITFRIEVKTSDPKPSLGAIVVENTAPGVAGSAAQREHIVVLTVPANTETTSTRVRPLLLRSPWIIVAMVGLAIAVALVWVGARRARRPKDILVPAGELEGTEAEQEDVQEASRPVIKRLGEVGAEPFHAAGTTTLLRERTQPRPDDDRPLLDDALLVEVEPDEDDLDLPRDDDDLIDDEREDDDYLPPARHRPAAKARPRSTQGSGTKKVASTRKKKTSPKAKTAANRKPSRPAAKKKTAARKPKPRRTSNDSGSYIPLDDL